MIVRVDGGDVVVVRQADHAELSGRLAAAWGKPPWEPPLPFPSTVIGARRHDDAWLGFDEAPELGENMLPKSFYEVDRVRTSNMYRRGIDAIQAIDPYAALLVSLHFSGFFHAHWGWEPFALPENFAEPQATALRDFVAGELDRQDRLRVDLGLRGGDERRLAANYFWLQLWDRISLDICRQDPTEPWVVEYPETPTTAETAEPRATLKLAMTAPGEYSLNPYPLRLDRLTVDIPATRIGNDGYHTPEQFLDLYRTTPPTYIRATLQPA